MSLSRLLPSAPLWRRLASSAPTVLGTVPLSRPLLHLRGLSVASVRFSPVKDPPGEEAMFIPEPPPSISADVPDPVEALNHLGEPTFESLGIGTSYFPSDFFLKVFETLHVSGNLPWWTTLIVSTVTMRLLIFPLVVRHRKMSINFQNNMPTLKKLQQRLETAQMQNNVLEMMHVSQEMKSFAERNKLVSLKDMLLFPVISFFASAIVVSWQRIQEQFSSNAAILIVFAHLTCIFIMQAGLVLSNLQALRKMANYPVTSLQEGGLLWFTDFCLPDPYFILPAVTCGSIYLMFFIGADMAKLSLMSPAVRYVMAGLPLVGFFFVMNFPAAITYYFMVSNCMAILQTSMLKIPKVNKFFDIPMEVKHVQEKETNKKGFLQTIKDNSERARMLRMVKDRERLDDERFRKAGTAPVEKTSPVRKSKKQRNL